MLYILSIYYIHILSSRKRKWSLIIGSFTLFCTHICTCQLQVRGFISDFLISTIKLTPVREACYLIMHEWPSVWSETHQPQGIRSNGQDVKKHKHRFHLCNTLVGCGLVLGLTLSEPYFLCTHAWLSISTRWVNVPISARLVIGTHVFIKSSLAGFEFVSWIRVFLYCEFIAVLLRVQLHNR